MAVLLLLLLFLPQISTAAESSLAIVQAGVQQSEDAPFVPSDYRFLPGDYLYFTFQVAGFAAKSENQESARKISLKYEATLQDIAGIALSEPASGAIEAELNPEDKDWIPKRRSSFLIPSFVAAGDFHVHLVIKDLFANTETSKDFPFHIGGEHIQASTGVTLENFSFLRSENDREALQVPAYSPGDTVYARFDMVGYRIGANNEYHLAYGLVVLGPTGKPYIQEPKAAELDASTFYPAQFVPGTLNLTTSSSAARGEYVVVLTVRDLIGKQSFEIKRAFTIEP
ncbi:MAG: hypothetical protein WB992_12945 [Bryobacteraceae bacterium]